MVFNLLILFNDGVSKVITDVTSYGVVYDGVICWFEKDGYKSFLPSSNISYFGREFDWDRQ